MPVVNTAKRFIVHRNITQAVSYGINATQLSTTRNATIARVITEETKNDSHQMIIYNPPNITSFLLIIVLSAIAFVAFLYVVCGPVLRTEAHKMVQDLNVVGINDEDDD
ncbi:hypothetical protein ACOME3_003288 [Neoechinorhynchus agilis]